jgi:hypothetical protein
VDVDDRDRRRVIALVERIKSSPGAGEEVTPLLEELKRSVPHPYPTDLIFYPEREFTSEEVADIALGWVPGEPLRIEEL